MFPDYVWWDKREKMLVMKKVSDRGIEATYQADLKSGVHTCIAIIADGVKFIVKGTTNVCSEGEACTFEDYSANLMDRSRR